MTEQCLLTFREYSQIISYTLHDVHCIDWHIAQLYPVTQYTVHRICWHMDGDSRRISAALQSCLVDHVKCSCVQLLKSVEEGTAKTEACLKMALADSIFDDIIGDTAEAFLDAHGLQTPPEIND